MPDALCISELHSLPLLKRGKVRDLYEIGDDHLLNVTDRLSAFDVVLPTPIPGKGEVLNLLSSFWFRRLAHIVPNHMTDIPLDSVLKEKREREQVAGRTAVVRRYRPLPVEAIVRGYLVGSGWKEYQRTGAVCGIALPPGLREADKLPEPIFTPSTKAEGGEHDENISFELAEELLGRKTAKRVRAVSLALYKEAAEYAASRGILIADTKFEFGVNGEGQLVLIDEALTPDSSRFWSRSAQLWPPGRNPPSFDKQYVRDYLDHVGWDKQPPVPELPPEVAPPRPPRNTARRLCVLPAAIFPHLCMIDSSARESPAPSGAGEPVDAPAA